MSCADQHTPMLSWKVGRKISFVVGAVTRCTCNNSLGLRKHDEKVDLKGKRNIVICTTAKRAALVWKKGKVWEDNN